MPKIEDGYTKIANEIMDALCRYRIPGEQRQCLDFILRKTYGFNKKEDRISNGQFCKATGLKKPSVCRALKGLIDKNIVSKKVNNYIPSYCFNKHYKKWKVLAKKITVSKKVILGVTKKLPTKESTTKEIKTFLSDSKEVRLSNLLLSKILQRNPDHKKPNIQTWAKEVDYMIRLDKRDPQKIANLIDWVQSDTFEQNNVLCTAKLRKRYDALFLKMGGGTGNNNGCQVSSADETTSMLDKIERR